jgi:ABC-2 type transport system permease protein
MKGLLLKDLYVLIKQMRVFLVIVIVFAVIPGSNMTIFATIYASMMPYTALAYDERSHWDQLACMMPYSMRDLVLSKYLLGWMFVGATAVVSLLASLVERPFVEQPVAPVEVALAVCLGIIAIALTLPCMFRFGVEKGRMFFIIFMVVIACGSAGLLSGILESSASATLIPLLTLALPVAAVILTLVSIPLSIRLFRARIR